MMPEPRPDQKITLEDLLRVKRAERPPTDFWTTFERELRTRQLAAAVGKRRWWWVSRAWSGFARFQVPVGAAAVLAVTFLTVREVRDSNDAVDLPVGGQEVAEVVNDPVVESHAPEVLELAVVNIVPTASARAETGSPPTPVQSTQRFSPATGFGLVDTAADSELTPSARSIAANLAAAEPELRRVLGSFSSLRLSEANQREPLAELTSPRDQRRERLFGYDPQLASYSNPSETEAPQRVASRLDDTTLYESVRRLSGGGDRLTVKF